MDSIFRPQDTVDIFNPNAVQEQLEEVHIRIFQRTTRKYITLVENLGKLDAFQNSKNLVKDVKKILGQIRKDFHCNGNVRTDPDTGMVILQLQGDQRDNVTKFLVSKGYCKEKQIKAHGF